MRFEGKTALVTGGSRGIGRACVAQLASEGAAVAFLYRSNQAAAESLVAELAAAPGASWPFRPTLPTSRGRDRSSTSWSSNGSISTFW